MRKTSVSTLVALAFLLSSPFAQGQTDKAAPPAAARANATGKSMPRLNDGKPDMQGYWTNQTFTPLERPAQFKDKAFFTAEEAKAFAERALEDVKDVPRGDQVKSDADIHYDDGIWLLEGYKKGAMLRTSIITDPADGRIPPLSAEGQKRAQVRAEARKRIGPFDSAQARGLSERCIYWAHEGPPILPTGYNSNLLIVQAPGTFVIQPEMMPVARIVPLNGRPDLGSAIRAYRGESRGHWDGDTMVIETNNYSEKTGWRGSSENLKTVERLTMTSPTTIRYQFTVEDASTWTRPWSGEYEMTRIDGPLFEYACHEGNYQLGTILRGARRAEEAAAQQKR
ncbi:MAG TPA: hypothetical protein VKB50_23815 [Vicinamibacterales bacterium]|nr:hypothetical protein [Vicinamibacterales bacterium]